MSGAMDMLKTFLCYVKRCSFPTVQRVGLHWVKQSYARLPNAMLGCGRLC